MFSEKPSFNYLRENPTEWLSTADHNWYRFYHMWTVHSSTMLSSWLWRVTSTLPVSHRHHHDLRIRIWTSFNASYYFAWHFDCLVTGTWYRRLLRTLLLIYLPGGVVTLSRAITLSILFIIMYLVNYNISYFNSYI